MVCELSYDLIDLIASDLPQYRARADSGARSSVEPAAASELAELATPPA